MGTIANTALTVLLLCALVGASQDCSLDFLVLKGDIVGMLKSGAKSTGKTRLATV